MPASQTSPMGVVAELFATARQAVSMFIARESQRNEFRRLDERMLHDIGIERHKIDGVVDAMFR
jgi:uncharacterized protein YjiS (DUF1127 family)